MCRSFDAKRRNRLQFSESRSYSVLRRTWTDWLSKKPLPQPKICEGASVGSCKVNYRLRDDFLSSALLGVNRSRFITRMVCLIWLMNSKLPLELPEVDKFLPTETGEPPLGHATKWAWDVVKGEVVENSKIDNVTVFPWNWIPCRDLLVPSHYYLRYMDPHNDQALVSEKADHYWQNVDFT